MKERISPVGLKGNEINERMKELMGITPINENLTRSSVELTKMGPDGNVYGIVRENHEYYIKVATKREGKLVAEDFSYIGGLKNKKQEAYPTYAKAIKHLNLKFNSLNEAYGKSGQINVFESDCYEMNEFDKQAMTNFIAQYGPEKGKQIYYATANKQDRNPETFEKNEAMMDELSGRQQDMASLAGDPNAIDAADLAAVRAGAQFEEETLNPEMQAIDDMMFEKKAVEAKPVEPKLSIERAINEMDEIIDYITAPRKKKVYTLK